ncbi:hypothetical protein [Raoultella ornithinolytica]|jgi:hypothetical protein|uniref:hypothetical protein n=1 Tax=Raoultella ornithinolytica TaxID=54291 RepID=UPI0020115C76|nr:hypothetical protein [Raoultella ornithinolytica]MDE5426130.1 hypothetical protein [Raoultella ornithinolytica]
MESARDKYTSEIIEAEDLWLLDVVDTNGYVCWGCGIEMYPSAWQKGSKKRPSFNKMPGKEHINCDADAESTVVKQGQKKSVRRMLDSAPGLMPAGLKLIEKVDGPCTQCIWYQQARIPLGPLHLHSNNHTA